MPRASSRGSPVIGGFVALEGGFLIERALAAGLELTELYCVPAREAWARKLVEAAGGRSPEPKLLAEADMADIAGYPFHRGAYALALRPAPRRAEDFLPAADSAEGSPAMVLVLPELCDPENLGAAFLNAAALGCSSLLLGPKSPDPLCRRVLRVSMGASLSLPWARLEGPEGLAILATRGFSLAACVLDAAAEDLRSWKRPTRLALMLGNEAFGLSDPWLEACSRRLTLPMMGGTDSLNLATAAAIFLYALAQ
jgi:tRNA G18 (ribose-2'-O)-methylase SpoU